MIDKFSDEFQQQSFNKSAILKIKYYKKEDIFSQCMPTKEEAQKLENNRLRIGYTVDTLTSVHVQKIVEIVGKAIEIYEAVI